MKRIWNWNESGAEAEFSVSQCDLGAVILQETKALLGVGEEKAPEAAVMICYHEEQREGEEKRQSEIKSKVTEATL